MNARLCSWTARCAVALVVVLVDVSRGQEAAKESPAAPQQDQKETTAGGYPLYIQNVEQGDLRYVPFASVYSAEGTQFRVYPDGSQWVVGFPTHGNPLGVEVAPVDAALRIQLNVAEGVGVVVTSIVPDSEAAKAGLKQHDIVGRINQHVVTGPAKFNELVSSEQGKKVTIAVVREGKPLNVEVTLPKTPVYQPAIVPSFVFDSEFIPEQSYRIGVTLSEADDTLRSQVKLAEGEGLVVTDVVADSPAAQAGIQRHDVLTKLDGKRLSTVEKINAQIQELKDRRVTIAFLRGGEEKTCEVAAQLSQPPAKTARLRNLRAEDFAVRWYDATRANDKLRTWRAGEYLAAKPRLQLRWPNAAASTAAGEQIAAIKKQLAELQKSLESLEATLQSPPADSPEKK